MNKQNIRNFCILAHIDHGKSTLADRFLECTSTVEKRKMREQYLDMHELEREKGITIKMQPVRMMWKPPAEFSIYNSQFSNNDTLEIAKLKIENSDSEYILNLIDTPGHVDFTYEVSRALAAVEGAILLVDAAQGVQAQTLANLHLAQKEGVVIIPAINKIDLPSADVPRVEKELEQLLGVIPSEIFKISAKMGTGVPELLAGVIKKTPPPHEEGVGQTRALIFDSKFDPYQGVIAHVRVFEGKISARKQLFFMASEAKCEALEVGIFHPARTITQELASGEIGYIATGIKELEKVRVGDTITLFSPQATQPLPGYKEVVPMIFASLFPEDQDEFDTLRDSLKKLKLEDAALMFEPEESSAFGRGYRVGFLGMLHMEIIAERLKREYDLELVFSNPSVAFRVTAHHKGSQHPPEQTIIYSASKMPESHDIVRIEEPNAIIEIITPQGYLGALTSLIHGHGGRILDTDSLSGDRLMLHFEAPLREIIVDFYDELKSVSQGFASMAYELSGYRETDLVRMDIMVAGDRIPTLAEIVPRQKVDLIARARLAKLKDLLPRELFAIALQAEVGGRIIARETIAAMRKDVTGYLYGGDRTRKMKLWKKQARGKKRLKESGSVDIPPEVFLKMFKK
ncbi:MAG: translation elongation factor 4 [bacterium]|nr:translation elongation factor 4 [bacterium]